MVNEKAVAVAKDVIAQIRSKEHPLQVASNNGYIVGPLAVLPDQPCDLQEIVDDVQSKCEVCALGAAVLSTARLLDNIPVGSVLWEGSRVDFSDKWFRAKRVVETNRDKLLDALSPIFDPWQCDMIEAAFERSFVYADTDISDYDIERSVNFGSEYQCDDDRLVAIMENVIENGGRFEP